MSPLGSVIVDHVWLAPRAGRRSGRLVSLALVLGTALTAVLVAGCMRPQPSPLELLDQSLHAFHGHLVFQRFDQAASFVPTGTRRDFLSYYEDQSDDFHITEYELTRLEVGDDQKSAHARIVLSWYLLPSTKVHTTYMDESWRFDETTSRWEVVEQRKDDKEEKRTGAGAATTTASR